jgi:hypothetical protein
MTTYRERRENKADRLREWADKRDTKATADIGHASTMAQAIPFGQPILVGHYSESRDRNYRGRIHSTFERGFEHQAKAADFNRRAGGIEAQLATSIYSDDPDACEALTARIDELEQERTRIKAYNASCRKGTPDLSVLTEAEKQSLVTLARVASYQLGKGGAFPAYHLSNLSGNIKRNRDRLASLQANKATGGRLMILRYDGTCHACDTDLPAGTTARYDRTTKQVTCTDCDEVTA